MNQNQKNTDKDMTNPGDIIAEEIHLLRRLFKTRQYRAYTGVLSDLVYMGGQLLDYIGRYPGATQSDLVVHFHRDKGQVAKLIRGLRERGMVETEVDKADRRSLRLHLTAKGYKTNADVQRERRKVVQLGLVGISDADQKQLVTLLRRVKRNLEEA
ncbi:MAG: MarR family transcriptional regulator [Emcibacter sp.]|nr:MarR family transcriptional regulator [Emcibacter sp.]